MKRLLGLLFVVAAAAQTQPDFTGPVTVEQIATGFENTEGPHWRAAGYLVFSDIRGDTVYQWTQAGGAEVFHRPSGNSNGLDEDSQGRLLVAQHGKRRMARLETGGAETALATHYGGKRLNSPNDIAVRSDGSTYFTDPPYGITPQEEELGFRGVYRVTGDPAAPELLVDNLDRPNGIVFSPDESLLYVADTTGLRVVAFDVADDGTLGNQRVFLTFSGSNRPDGMEVDGAGNLYVAGTQGSVWIYSPAGDLIGSIDVPERTRNLAWGGTDGRSLFVTSGASVYRVRAVPGAGQFPEFTLLPGGEYEMGDHHDLGGAEHRNDEVPVHTVQVDPFYAGVTEVTNRQYLEFLNAAISEGAIEVREGMVYRTGSDDAYSETRQADGFSAIEWDGQSFRVRDGRERHPVIGIRWFGAAAYTNWLSEQHGYEPCYDPATWECNSSKNGYRLPTEAEWEYAGRGGLSAPYRIYPWGDDADPSRANWPNSGDCRSRKPDPPVSRIEQRVQLGLTFAARGLTSSTLPFPVYLFQFGDGSARRDFAAPDVPRKKNGIAQPARENDACPFRLLGARSDGGGRQPLGSR